MHSPEINLKIKGRKNAAAANAVPESGSILKQTNVHMSMSALSDTSKQMHKAHRVMPIEPELPEVADEDKTIVRNVLYAIWVMQEEAVHCLSWNVQTTPTAYIVTVNIGSVFSVSLMDMQIVRDMSPLRIEHVMLRNPIQAQVDGEPAGCCITVKVLNSSQKVSLTEADVVRLKKRQRSWFS